MMKVFFRCLKTLIKVSRNLHDPKLAKPSYLGHLLRFESIFYFDWSF